MLEIREYQSEDLAQFTGLIADLSSPASMDEMKARMKRIENNPNYCTFVAIEEKTLVGMIGITVHSTYTTNAEKIQITALVTKNEYRGRGIARTLVKHVEGWSVKRGSDFIYLLSGASEKRKTAHDLYRFLGYQVTGYRFVKHLKTN